MKTNLYLNNSDDKSEETRDDKVTYNVKTYLYLFDDYASKTIEIEVLLEKLNNNEGLEKSSVLFLRTLNDYYDNKKHSYYFKVFEMTAENLLKNTKLEAKEKDEIEDLLAIEIYRFNFNLIKKKQFKKAKKNLIKYVNRPNTFSLYQIQKVLIEYKIKRYLKKGSYKAVIITSELLKKIDEEMSRVKEINPKVAGGAYLIFDLINDNNRASSRSKNIKSGAVKKRKLGTTIFIEIIVFIIMGAFTSYTLYNITLLSLNNRLISLIILVVLIATLVTGFTLNRIFKSFISPIIYTILIVLAVFYISKTLVEPSVIEDLILQMELQKLAAINVNYFNLSSYDGFDLYQVGLGIINVVFTAIALIILNIESLINRPSKFNNIIRIICGVMFLGYLSYWAYSLIGSGFHIITFSIPYDLTTLIVYNITLVSFMLGVFIVLKFIGLNNKICYLILLLINSVVAIFPNVLLVNKSMLFSLPVLITLLERLFLSLILVFLLGHVFRISYKYKLREEQHYTRYRAKQIIYNNADLSKSTVFAGATNYKGIMRPIFSDEQKSKWKEMIKAPLIDREELLLDEQKSIDKGIRKTKLIKMFEENSLKKTTNVKGQTNERTTSFGIKGKLNRFAENKKLINMEQISKVNNVFFNKDKKQHFHPSIELEKGEHIKAKNLTLLIEFPYEAVFFFEANSNQNN